MSFWVLTLSYWIHLIATVIWLGGLVVMAFIAWPALQRQTLQQNQWIDLQKQLNPWINGSLILLLITGFVQMTNDPNYTGFLNIDSLWAGALLVKHIAIVGMILIALYSQAVIQPNMARVKILSQKNPATAATEQDALLAQEIKLLRLNLFCAVLVLLFTAVATAI